MRTVLFIMGVEDSNLVQVHSIGPRGANYNLRGSIDLYRDLRHPQLKKMTLVVGGLQSKVPAVAKPDLIFNCITDADSSSRALRLAMQVIQQHKVPVINRPVHVLKTRRDDVAAVLADIPGVVMPATVRIKPDSHREILDALAQGPVRYPAIIRRIGTHGGESMIVLNSPQDAHLLERIACDGTEYYLINFVDYRDDDGLYRKARLVVVGNQVFARHLLASTHWNVHSDARQGVMKERPELVQQEEKFLSSFGTETFPALAERMKAIKERLKLDYFSIDCSLRPNGDLLIFEANASGNALRQADLDTTPHLRKPLQNLRAGVLRMLLQQPG